MHVPMSVHGTANARSARCAGLHVLQHAGQKEAATALIQRLLGTEGEGDQRMSSRAEQSQPCQGVRLVVATT